SMFYFFFFFQAQDGIRDFHVTGVQTCALPICVIVETETGGKYLFDTVYVMLGEASSKHLATDLGACCLPDGKLDVDNHQCTSVRSEERRVGKERRSRWWACHEKKRKHSTRRRK